MQAFRATFHANTSLKRGPSDASRFHDAMSGRAAVADAIPAPVASMVGEAAALPTIVRPGSEPDPLPAAMVEPSCSRPPRMSSMSVEVAPPEPALRAKPVVGVSLAGYRAGFSRP